VGVARDLVDLVVVPDVLLGKAVLAAPRPPLLPRARDHAGKPAGLRQAKARPELAARVQAEPHECHPELPLTALRGFRKLRGYGPRGSAPEECRAQRHVPDECAAGMDRFMASGCSLRHGGSGGSWWGGR